MKNITAKMSKKQLIAAAPKYVLYMESMGFLADSKYQDLNSSNVVFTTELNLAEVFATGFDNPAIKLGIWNACAKYNKIAGRFEAVDFTTAGFIPKF